MYSTQAEPLPDNHNRITKTHTNGESGPTRRISWICVRIQPHHMHIGWHSKGTSALLVPEQTQTNITHRDTTKTIPPPKAGQEQIFVVGFKVLPFDLMLAYGPPALHQYGLMCV